MANKNKRVGSWMLSFSERLTCSVYSQSDYSLTQMMESLLKWKLKDSVDKTFESTPVVKILFPKRIQNSLFYYIEKHADFVIWLCCEPALDAH